MLKENKQESYYGGKGSDGTFQKIINRIPKTNLLIETHAGFARISEKMKDRPFTILNDINPKICNKLKLKFKDSIVDNISSDYLFSDAGRNKIYIENMDAIELLERYSVFINNETVLFIDPPYPLLSRKLSKDRYEFEMTDSQHNYLLQYLLKLSCKQLICTYPNELYQSILYDYNLFEYYNQTRRGLALEYLFMNFDTPTVLQDASYFGDDYRQREKFKLMQRNFIDKFLSFPVPIQNRVLNQPQKINSTDGQS